jgi:hypothetical protein
MDLGHPCMSMELEARKMEGVKRNITDLWKAQKKGIM